MPAIPGFLGGQDVQRSLNLADNRLVNLYPTTDDSGAITAFYATPGLAAYTSAASTFSGLYTASNGRCFGVSGTTLYEITTGGVLTSRGTVTTATVSKMSDNGIELIIVNGTDAWLFTFATNALKKISTLSSDFTVTIASPAVFTTVAAHGLVAGDAIQLTTTTGSNVTSGVITKYGEIESPLNTVERCVISPDNNNVYITQYNSGNWNGSNDVYQYLRDPVTGNLSALSPPTASKGALLIVAQNELAFSQDGAFVFATGGISGPNTRNLFTYLRSQTTGVLSYLSNFDIGAGNNYVPSLSSSVSIYDDGLNGPFLYVRAVDTTTSTWTNYILQYSYGRATGTVSALTPLAVAVGTSSLQGNAFRSFSCIPADGKHLYVAEYANSKIHMFPRNATTGLLSAVTSISCGANPVGIARSADNNNIYVITGANGGSLEVYTRNTTTGVLTLASTLLVGNATSITISADDTSVYVGSSGTSLYEFDRNTSTGALTAMSTPVITMANSGSAQYVSIAPNGKNVYATSNYSSSINFHNMTIFTRQQSALNVGLPTGLATLTTYYVIAAGLTANNFEVSLTSGGTAVNTSGVQAGTHTFHTIGNGFPNGAKTVSYIDGRFVACQPNTQNFYVSDVLAGGSWNPLNVQTADSNPDMIVGQTTIHNELIVFCEQSGEAFYDSGTYPAPFVRNVSGIFEVGCIAPYSIAKIDNSVMWLGKSNTGQGVIYRLNGYTPVRLSTYAIEYAIQTMTTITDAQAFTYQQEGHHFYVITFPTGGRTFAFDINTNLWHERAGWNGVSLSRWAAKEYTFFDGKHLVCDYASGNIYSLDLGVFMDGANAKKWIRSFRAPPSDMKRVIHNKLTLEAEVGVGAGTASQTGVVNSINIDTVGTSGNPSFWFNKNVIPSGAYTAMIWSGSMFVAVGTNLCATSPDGITWTARTIPAGTYTSIAYNGSVFCAASPTVFATSPDGINWTSHAGFGAGYSQFSVCYGNGVFCLACVYYSGFQYFPVTAISTDGFTWTNITTSYGNVASGAGASLSFAGGIFLFKAYIGAPNNTNVLYTSTNGITFTPRYSPAYSPNGGHTNVAYSGSLYVFISPGTSYLTSSDGITWTVKTFPVSLNSPCISYGGGIFCVVDTVIASAYTSPDGITWTAVGYSSVGRSDIAYNGSYFCAIPATTSTDVLTSQIGYPLAGTYAVTFTGGGGTGAAGTYTISPSTGQITSASLTNGGANYTTQPAISFIYGGITGATGHVGMTWTPSYNPSGTAPMVSLKYSNDGGHTWSKDNWRDMSLGIIGEYSKRVYWYRLGMTTGQTRLYELSGVASVKTVLINAYLE